MHVVKPLKIAVLRPGCKDWVHQDLYPDRPGSDSHLKGLQAIVGGLIQALPMCRPGVEVYLNEEGLLLDLPISARWTWEGEPAGYLRGPLIAVGPLDDDGNDTDITDEALTILAEMVTPTGTLAATL